MRYSGDGRSDWAFWQAPEIGKPRALGHNRVAVGRRREKDPDDSRKEAAATQVPPEIALPFSVAAFVLNALFRHMQLF